VTDVAIDFTGGDVNGLDVLLTQQKTDLSGAVTNDRGETVTDATVIAFADDPEKWGQSSRFIESVSLDQNGQFRLQNLPAGTYVVVAIDDLEPGEERNPDVLSQLRSKGSRVALRDGETRKVDVKVASY
jgi:Carboxypeptidase regulatory-like domain